MGILGRNLSALFSVAAVFLLYSCSRNSPVTSTGQNLSLQISAPFALKEMPEELHISIGSESDYWDERHFNNVQNPGSAIFPGVPYGPVFVDVTGYSNGNRTLYGHNEMHVGEEHAHILVTLRNIIEVQNLNQAQEESFLSGLQRSVFWDDLVARSTARCVTPDNRVVLKTTIASTPRYLYFLFIVDDQQSFSPSDHPFTTTGEMVADAVIMYVSKIPPHMMTPDRQSIPVVRFQFETGRVTPATGNFELKNLETGFTREDAISALTTDDITARIERQIYETRVIELRIRKGLLNLPEDTDAEKQFSIVIRYRDGDREITMDQLCDWQTGTEASNPRLNSDSWGYMEIVD